jgi:transposase
MQGWGLFDVYKPADTDKFRKAVLGQNKDNRRDAESVARYAMALEAQGKLERYRRVWFADAELQLLTRGYERKSQAVTAELNRLWKLLRLASADLYLALGGGHPEVELTKKALQSQGVLTLLSQKPDLGQWKDLSAEQMLEAMGGGKYKGRQKLIEQLRTLAGSFPTVSPAMALLIRTGAQQIQRLKAEQTEIIRMLEALTTENMAVHALKQIPGIATLTASTLLAEIIDIRRFPREDSLACYSGLGMKEHSTGDNFRMVRSQLFNHRLKDAFMSAARNFVQYNPESHLAGYHRNLLKRGMSPTQATKRVARALVRVIHRQLSALVVQHTDMSTATQKEEGEGNMASGWIRSDRSHTSNMPPSSLTNTKDSAAKNVKGLPSQIGRAHSRRTTTSRKTA